MEFSIGSLSFPGHRVYIVKLDLYPRPSNAAWNSGFEMYKFVFAYVVAIQKQTRQIFWRSTQTNPED